MAALTIGTVTTVEANPRSVSVGEAITALEVLYDSEGTHYLAEANDTDKDTPAALSAMPAASGGKCIILQNGDRVNLGAILTKGIPYYMGRTAGTIVPFADLATPDKVVQVLYAETTSIAVVQIVNPPTDIIL